VSVFRSRRRDVVFPQSEHARLAASLAQIFGASAEVQAGIAWHDRGYPPLDADDLATVSDERWRELMRTGFDAESVSPLTDHVARMHIHRLVGRHHGDLAAAWRPALEASRARAGLSAAQAAAIDRITEACDTAAFDFCLEAPAAGTAGGVGYAVDGAGGITYDPWPDGAAPVSGWILAFHADGYPQRTAPLVVPFHAEPR
jgi:hypothetical protein